MKILPATDSLIWPRRPATVPQMKAADFLPDARDKATIIIAELPDGRQFKLTGYSRTAIWARSPEAAPTHVNVIVVPVASADEIARLHDEFEQLLSKDMM